LSPDREKPKVCTEETFRHLVNHSARGCNLKILCEEDTYVLCTCSVFYSERMKTRLKGDLCSAFQGRNENFCLEDVDDRITVSYPIKDSGEVTLLSVNT